MKRFLRVLVWGCLLLTGWAGSAQQSPNFVDFRLTYNPSTMRYTAYVVPRYDVPNSAPNNNNTGTVEKGGTAQFTIKVPSTFTITNITDVVGQWEKAPLRLGPGNAGQDWTGSGLDPAINYYVIGKSPSESSYGTFMSGIPVALFTFQGNGCFGPLSPLEPGNAFIAEADQRYSLNVANSFYSLSGTPPGGNQTPLEQFRTVTGAPAQCASLIASPDSQTLTAGITTTIPVLTNDTSNGQPASTTSVTVSISTPPASGTATVNPNGTISFTPAPGFTGPISFTYAICDIIQPTVCSSAPISLTVNPAPTVLTANPDSQTLTAGLPATIPVLANDFNNGLPASTTSVTVSISTPPASGTATVNPNGTIDFTPATGFTGPISFTYTICDIAQSSVCASAPVSLTVNPAPAVLVATPDNQTLTAGLTTTIPVLANDTSNGQPASTTNVIVTVGTPASGTATVNPDGTISFTPAPGFTGPVSFTYTICSLSQPMVCSSAPISLTVNPAPVILVANPDFATTAAGSPVTASILANDTRNGQPASTTNVTVALASQPTNGTAVLNANGTVTYTPAPGFSGVNSFSYTICDIAQPGICSTAIVFVTVTSTPVANPDSQTLTAGLTTTIPVLANDTSNGQPASTTNVTVTVSTPASGTATVNPNGTISFTPAPGFTGPISFTYTICSLSQPTVCSSAPISLTVNPAPTVLTANPDGQTLTAGLPATIPVLANDFNNGLPASTTSVTVSISTPPASGTATVNPNGTISFTPATGFTGPISFTYTICDIAQSSVCASAPVILTVNPAPVVLVATPDNQTLTAGLTTTIPVLANDTSNGQPASTTSVTVSISTPPASGTATVNPNGTISFTPATGFTGPISFTYTICDIAQSSVCASAPVILTVNPAPVVLVATPDNQTLTAGLTTTIPVLANDTSNGQPASTTNVTVTVSTPASGTATVNPNGTISFTPAPGFTGPISFTYTICSLSQPTVCSSAPISLTVNPAPTVLTANPDGQTLTAGLPATIPVLANDFNNGLPASTTSVTVSISTPPASGTATVNPNGTIDFTPATGFTGPISFTYTICDIAQSSVCASAPVSLTVNPAPAVLVATPDNQTLTAGLTTTIPVLANDTSNGQPASTTNVIVTVGTPASGTATVNPNGTISFTPAPGFTGPISFTYTICSLSQPTVCSSAPISLTVNPAPTVLTANPDGQTLTAGLPATIPVLANDFNNGLPASTTSVTVSISTPPASGTATVNPNGTISFTPATGFTGPISFTYTICDIAQSSVCASAPVILTVNPAPVVLVATPDNQTLTAGLTTTIPVLANDTSNGQPASTTSVTVSISTPPASGTATVNPNGTIDFTPATGFTGPISFTYTICDIAQSSVCASAPVSLTVNPAPAVLVATPDNQTLTAGLTTTIPVLANDTSNGQPASTTNVIVTVGTPASGTATVNPDGTISFTPAPGFTGPVSFTYTICSLSQPMVCSSAPISLTVNPAPVILVANPDFATTAAGSPVTASILANDTRNGQPASTTNVTVALASQPTNGTAVLNANGTVTYTPAPGFSGVNSFSYTICDIAQPGICSTAIVFVTVTSTPVANPDSQTLTAGLTTTIPVLANDTSNGQPASTTNVTVTVSTPASGTATVNPNGTISFTPAPGFTGPISFTYTICSLSQPTVCSSAPISLTVNPAPTVLTANPDGQTLTAGLPATIPVLANDFNNGLPASTTSVTVSISTPPASGTATVNPNGTISFTPATGFTGPISFTYTICDIAQSSVCASAPVILTVNPAPVVLVATPDNQTLTAGLTTTIPVLANDTSNGQPASTTSVTVSISTPPASGTATVNPNGTISFTPATGFTGPISFTYTICDIAQSSVCASAPVILTVNPAPVVLVATPDNQTLTAGLTTTIPVLANDTSNGQPASTTNVIVTVGTPASGTATVNPDGTISFTPAPGFTGPVSFTYTICSLSQPTVCSSAPISLTVNPAPTQSADLLITKQVNQASSAVGDVVSFTITVQNMGPASALGVSVTDTLLRTSSVQLQGTPTPSKGSFNATTGLWTVGDMAANETATFVLSVRIIAEGVIVNVASVTATGSQDPNVTNNQASACTSVPYVLCSGESLTVSVPRDYQDVRWYRNNDPTPVFTGNSVTIDLPGTYKVSSSNGTCPIAGCCPVVVQQGNCCPTDKCVPFVIRKTRIRL